MITYTRLGKCGRLGNQLWQIASTAGIAQSLGRSVGFASWDYRPYFNIPDVFFPGDVFDHARPWPVLQAHQTSLVSHIDTRAREYLQDYGLWESIAPQVKSWFQPSDAAMEVLKRDYDWFWELERPLLSVHVRRGDNAKAPNNSHPLRPWSFYEQAIERMRGDFRSIAVFSDDPDWCRGAFAGYEVEYPVAFVVGTPRAKEHEKAYLSGPILDWIDLQLMSFCDAWVIGNSTYAWWGAWLGWFTHQDSSVFYPSPWFGRDLQYIDAGLMFPDTWTRLEHGQIVV